MPKRKQKTAQ